MKNVTLCFGGGRGTKQSAIFERKPAIERPEEGHPNRGIFVWFGSAVLEKTRFQKLRKFRKISKKPRFFVLVWKSRGLKTSFGVLNIHRFREGIARPISGWLQNLKNDSKELLWGFRIAGFISLSAKNRSKRFSRNRENRLPLRPIFSAFVGPILI
jgi:hypothetical protein